MHQEPAMQAKNLPLPLTEYDEPLISVIVPVFQGERLIEGAVQSVLLQSHRNLEVIVVDDGSTDATLAKVQRLVDPRLRVIAQNNAGTAAARNSAIEIARGDYIAFLDCDDRWFPTKLAAELRVLRDAEPDIGIAYSSYYAVDDRGRLLNAAPARTVCGDVFEFLLDGDDFLMPSVCLFDRRVVEAIGHFNARNYHEDHEFILRATQKYPIFPTRERLIVYRQSTSGKCRSILQDFDRARAAELATIEYVNDALNENQLGRLRENALRSLSCRFLMYGFNRHARRLLQEIDASRLRTNKKGWLAWIFAWSGINLLQAARLVIQAMHLVFLQPAWSRLLARAPLALSYD